MTRQSPAWIAISVEEQNATTNEMRRNVGPGGPSTSHHRTTAQRDAISGSAN